MTWQALVLAGTRAGAADPVAVATGVAHKAFAPVAGKPMIERVLATLAAVPEIAAITVSIEDSGAPVDTLATAPARITAAASPARSVAEGLAATGTPLLVTTADHPLLTAAMVTDFLRDAAASWADIAAGLSPRPVVERAGNTAKRTYLKFADAEFSGCNLFALTTQRAVNAVRFWQAVESDRKNPLRIARHLGPVTLARYAAGRLSSAQAAAALGKKAGCRAAIIPVHYPDAAHDVDKPADLAFAEARLAARETA
ncbi:MAG: NTP transferase domain-containing protein [Pseudomonadota bacterium]